MLRTVLTIRVIVSTNCLFRWLDSSGITVTSSIVSTFLRFVSWVIYTKFVMPALDVRKIALLVSRIKMVRVGTGAAQLAPYFMNPTGHFSLRFLRGVRLRAIRSRHVNTATKLGGFNFYP